MATIEPDRDAVRQALERESRRLVAMVRGGARLSGPVPGLEWTQGQVIAHLCVVCRVFATAVRGESYGPEVVAAVGAGDTLPEVVAETNARALEMVSFQETAEAADGLETSAAELLDAVDAQPDFTAERATPWYGPRVELTVGTLVSLAVTELLMHGDDLARAIGVSRRPSAGTTSSATAAAPTVMTAMLPLLVDQQRTRRLSASFEVRIRGGERFVMHVEEGRAWSEPARGQKVDCVMSLSGYQALLIGHRRLPVWRGIVSGGAFAFGRRPWLGPRFPSLFLNT